MYRREDVNRLCVWIRRTITSSPIEYLHIICDGPETYSNAGANVSIDGLISHLAKKHAATLRFLHLSSSYVGTDSLRLLFQTCVNLEELSVAAGSNALVRRSK